VLSPSVDLGTALDVVVTLSSKRDNRFLGVFLVQKILVFGLSSTEVFLFLYYLAFFDSMGKGIICIG